MNSCDGRIIAGQLRPVRLIEGLRLADAEENRFGAQDLDALVALIQADVERGRHADRARVLEHGLEAHDFAVLVRLLVGDEGGEFAFLGQRALRIDLETHVPRLVNLFLSVPERQFHEIRAHGQVGLGRDVVRVGGRP